MEEVLKMDRNDWMKELRKIAEEQLSLLRPDQIPDLPENARTELADRWQQTRDKLADYLFRGVEVLYFADR
jgi:predicted GNAT superfamily acetyltransferase